MTRFRVALLATVATFAPATAQVVTAVTPPISSSTWTDIGSGPLRIWTSGRARYAISDATPAAGMLGFPVSDDPIDVTTTSDVWVISAAPNFTTQVFYAPVTAGGGGGGGGAVTLAANAVAAGAYKSGSFVSGALADGAIATLGTEADTAWATGSGTAIAILKTIAGNTAAGGGAVSLAAGAVHAGAYLSGSVLSGAFADGAETTIGTEADTAWASGNGTVVAILKKISGNTSSITGSTTITGPLGAQTTTAPGVSVTETGVKITAATLGTGGVGGIGWLSDIATHVQDGFDATTLSSRVIPTSNVAPIDCSGTATGTPSNITGLGITTIHGFTIQDENGSVSIGFSLTGTASIGAAGTFTLLPTGQSPNSYTTPVGFGSNHSVSVVSASSAVYTCTAF